MIRYLINYLLFMLPPTRLFFLRRFFLRISRVELGKGVSPCSVWIYGRGRFIIGDNSWLSPGVVAHTHVNGDIRIGKRCDIGPGVKFITGGHAIGPSSRRAGEGSGLPITIGDGCWIGAHCLILGGVEIGAGTVVAAGAVVTRNLPDNCLAAGVPAQVKRKLA